jgi:hypothetical protein
VELKKSYLETAKRRLDQDIEVANALYHRPIAHILLIHIGAFDAEVLPDLLKIYKDRGVHFISLAEALKDPIFEEDPAFASASGDDFQYNILKSRGLTPAAVGIRTRYAPPKPPGDYCK